MRSKATLQPNQLGFVNNGQISQLNQSKNEDVRDQLEMSQDQFERSSSDDDYKMDTNEESRIQQQSIESGQERSSIILSSLKVETFDNSK